MKRRVFLYCVINILVLIALTLLFSFNYINAGIFRGQRIKYIAVIFVSAVIVHFLKAARLYLAFYGSGLSIHHYVKIYCKVTPVSILLPFKLGEFFRMYCYGCHINNMLKGIITVILDRFMDTIALVTMILIVWVASRESIMPLAYFLFIFLVAIVLLFITFPGTYKYWKKILLRADGTVRKLKILKVLEDINLVYEEIAGVSKGRGIILYVISLFAWITEIGSVILLNRNSDNSKSYKKITEYLTSALSSSQSLELKQFIFISVVVMMIIYLLVKVVEIVTGERKTLSLHNVACASL